MLADIFSAPDEPLSPVLPMRWDLVTVGGPSTLIPPPWNEAAGLYGDFPPGTTVYPEGYDWFSEKYPMVGRCHKEPCMIYIYEVSIFRNRDTNIFLVFCFFSHKVVVPRIISRLFFSYDTAVVIHDFAELLFRRHIFFVVVFLRNTDTACCDIFFVFS